MDFLSYFKSLNLSKEFHQDAIETDFSDGVLIAQAIEKHMPDVVNIKEFDEAALSPTRKHLNWVKLNGKYMTIVNWCSESISPSRFPS